MSLPHAIMTALLEEQLTGYQLAKQFDVSLGFFWAASHQQIYKSLKDLQGKGLVSGLAVEQKGKPDKRVYALTEEGRSSLDAWILGATKVKSAKDDLLVKLYNLENTNQKHIEKLIGERRREHCVRLELYRKIEARQYLEPETLSKRKKGIYLALLGGILQTETSIRWCDECLSLLE